MDYKSCFGSLGDKKESIKICNNIVCKMNALYGLLIYLCNNIYQTDTPPRGENWNNAHVGGINFHYLHIYMEGNG